MKFPFDLLWKPLLVAAVVVAVTAPLGAVIFAGGAQEEGGSGGASVLGLLFLTDLLFVAVLIFPIRRSRLPGFELFGAVFLAIFGLNVLLTQTEALFFLDMAAAQVGRVTLFMTIKAAVVAALAVLAFRSPHLATSSPATDSRPWTTALWVRNIAACALAYMLLYLVAGMLIWPGVRSFYETQEMSVPPLLMPLLGVARGIVYLAVLLPLLRSVAASRRQLSLSMGLMVPVLSGAVALLLPNPEMPEAVRLLHMVEISWSNLVFGLLVGALFWNPAAATTMGGDAPSAREGSVGSVSPASP